MCRQIAEKTYHMLVDCKYNRRIWAPQCKNDGRISQRSKTHLEKRSKVLLFLSLGKFGRKINDRVSRYQEASMTSIIN
jgi:hypothetical protein